MVAVWIAGAESYIPWIKMDTACPLGVFINDYKRDVVKKGNHQVLLSAKNAATAPKDERKLTHLSLNFFEKYTDDIKARVTSLPTRGFQYYQRERSGFLDISRFEPCVRDFITSLPPIKGAKRVLDAALYKTSIKYISSRIAATIVAHYDQEHVGLLSSQDFTSHFFFWFSALPKHGISLPDADLNMPPPLLALGENADAGAKDLDSFFLTSVNGAEPSASDSSQHDAKVSLQSSATSHDSSRNQKKKSSITNARIQNRAASDIQDSTTAKLETRKRLALHLLHYNIGLFYSEGREKELEDLKRILTKPPQERLEREIDTLMAIVENVNFFNRYDTPVETKRRLCSYLGWEETTQFGVSYG